MSNCLTCKWAEWQLTKHATPRVKDAQGRCVYQIQVLPLPAWAGTIHVRADIHSVDRQLWPDAPYEKCPTWEKAQS